MSAMSDFTFFFYRPSLKCGEVTFYTLPMQLCKAFRFEILPNGEQIRKMKQFCGCSRFVFNRALAYQNEQYEADKSFKFSYAKITSLLPHWKKELPWLKDCHSQVLQQSLKDLERAFKNFFAKRSALPKFKKKRRERAFPFSARLQTGTTR